jgi:hypothetical protein
MSKSNEETLLKQNTDDNNTSVNDVPLEMDIDNTSTSTPLQPSLPIQTANDSMHAKPKDDDFFNDTGFDYVLPPVEKGKQKQT